MWIVSPCLVIQQLVLRIRQLQPAAAAHLHHAKQHHVLPGLEHVAEERLVQPGRAQGAARIADECLEDLESGAAGRSKTAAEDAGRDRRGLSRPERRNGPELTAVFVSDRKPVQQVLDGLEAGALEVGGATRADALQKLQRRLEHRVVDGHRLDGCERPALLDDSGLPALDLNLADPGRQRERRVEADAGGILRRAREEGDDFLEH